MLIPPDACCVEKFEQIDRLKLKMYLVYFYFCFASAQYCFS